MSFEDAKNHFDSSTKDTLVVFDIDETLLIPNDPAFQKSNVIKHNTTITNIKEQLLEKDQRFPLKFINIYRS